MVPQLPGHFPQLRPQMPTPSFAPQIPTAPPTPAASSAPRGFCKYWLPEACFQSSQDLRELIAGQGGAHFQHVLKKFPSVDLRIDGVSSLNAPPAHRLHVSMSSEDSEIFEAAAADVLDLIETVCDMVGEELGFSEDQVENLIRQVRAEKYFEAHGIRTPLPPTRSSAAQAPAPVVDSAVADFEFIDEDIDMEPAKPAEADTDDDALTEASDLLSDITEDEDGPKGPTFDDI